MNVKLLLELDIYILSLWSCPLAFAVLLQCFKMSSIMFCGLCWTSLLYLDDIHIFLDHLEEYHKHVSTVFKILRKNQLYIKLNKCEFEQLVYPPGKEGFFKMVIWVQSCMHMMSLSGGVPHIRCGVIGVRFPPMTSDVGWLRGAYISVLMAVTCHSMWRSWGVPACLYPNGEWDLGGSILFEQLPFVGTFAGH